MEGEKDRFGEIMRLVELAKEDIYFAAKDQELIEKLKARVKQTEGFQTENQAVQCLKCGGKLQNYSFMGPPFDRCQSCGAVWLRENADCASCI